MPRKKKKIIIPEPCWHNVVVDRDEVIQIIRDLQKQLEMRLEDPYHVPNSKPWLENKPWLAAEEFVERIK